MIYKSKRPFLGADDYALLTLADSLVLGDCLLLQWELNLEPDSIQPDDPMWVVVAVGDAGYLYRVENSVQETLNNVLACCRIEDRAKDFNDNCRDLDLVDEKD